LIDHFGIAHGSNSQSQVQPVCGGDNWLGLLSGNFNALQHLREQPLEQQQDGHIGVAMVRILNSFILLVELDKVERNRIQLCKSTEFTWLHHILVDIVAHSLGNRHFSEQQQEVCNLMEVISTFDASLEQLDLDFLQVGAVGSEVDTEQHPNVTEDLAAERP
jgi:hypothetical protein